MMHAYGYFYSQDHKTTITEDISKYYKGKLPNINELFQLLNTQRGQPSVCHTIRMFLCSTLPANQMSSRVCRG